MTPRYAAPMPAPDANDPPPPPIDAGHLTLQLQRAAEGDRAAAELLPLIYQQLRAAAQNSLNNERPGHTLQATALVHEAFLRLAGPREIPWQNRAHFYAAAAQAMRRILIDHARAKAARPFASPTASPNQPPDAAHLDDLADVQSLSTADPQKILAVEAAFARLEVEDPDAASVVRLRFYAGLSVAQTALCLNLSERTVARLWTYARARLLSVLRNVE